MKNICLRRQANCGVSNVLAQRTTHIQLNQVLTRNKSVCHTKILNLDVHPSNVVFAGSLESAEWLKSREHSILGKGQ